MAQNEQQGGQGNGNGIDPVVLDDIINRLLEFRQARTARQVQLSENEIRQLCAASREIFLQQPNLLELEAPIKICGIYFCVVMLYLFVDWSIIFSIFFYVALLLFFC